MQTRNSSAIRSFMISNLITMPVAFIENIFGVRFNEATRAVRLTSKVFRGMLSFFMTA
jgi:hypothetical protein